MNNAKNKTVVVTGGTGFIGKALTLELFRKGYKVRVLTRDSKRAQKNSQLPLEFFTWDTKSDPPSQAFDGDIFGVIHLAGESVAGQRWNEERKKEIYDSRVQSTQKLVGFLKKQNISLKSFVCASAIGYYGDRGNEELTENSKPTDDFLAKVCVDWEKAALEAKSLNIPTRIVRVGIVLGRNGGALQSMLPPFKMGVGGPLGSGSQYMSWIHLDDIVGLFIHALEKTDAPEVLNGTAPTPVTNKVFSKALGKALCRPAIFPTPAAMLKIALGEMARVVLASQNVKPVNALKSGYVFKFADLAAALADIISPMGFRGAYRLTTYQWLSAPREKVFDFFSRAENLETLTPEWLHFKILKKSSPVMKKDMTIEYRIKIHGVPVRWLTVIKDWTPETRFIDFQVKGPYKVWHHTHLFEDVHGGTLICDDVIYEMPFGPVGTVTHKIMVEKDVNQIFNFRREQISKIFNADK